MKLRVVVFHNAVTVWDSKLVLRIFTFDTSCTADPWIGADHVLSTLKTEYPGTKDIYLGVDVGTNLKWVLLGANDIVTHGDRILIR